MFGLSFQFKCHHMKTNESSWASGLLWETTYISICTINYTLACPALTPPWRQNITLSSIFPFVSRVLEVKHQFFENLISSIFTYLWVVELSFNSNEFGRVLLVKPSMFGKLEFDPQFPNIECYWFKPPHDLQHVHAPQACQTWKVLPLTPYQTHLS